MAERLSVHFWSEAVESSSGAPWGGAFGPPRFFLLFFVRLLLLFVCCCHELSSSGTASKIN